MVTETSLIQGECPDWWIDPSTGEIYTPDELDPNPREAIAVKKHNRSVVETFDGMIQAIESVAFCSPNHVIPKVTPEVKVGETDTLMPEDAKHQYELYKDAIFVPGKGGISMETLESGHFLHDRPLPEGGEGSGCTTKVSPIFSSTEPIPEGLWTQVKEFVWLLSTFLLEIRNELKNGQFTSLRKLTNLTDCVQFVKTFPDQVPFSESALFVLKFMMRQEKEHLDPLLLENAKLRSQVAHRRRIIANVKRNLKAQADNREHLAELKGRWFEQECNKLRTKLIQVLDIRSSLEEDGPFKTGHDTFLLPGMGKE